MRDTVTLFKFLNTEVCFLKSQCSYYLDYYIRILLFDFHNGKKEEIKNVFFSYNTIYNTYNIIHFISCLTGKAHTMKAS